MKETYVHYHKAERNLVLSNNSDGIIMPHKIGIRWANKHNTQAKFLLLSALAKWWRRLIEVSRRRRRTASTGRSTKAFLSGRAHHQRPLVLQRRVQLGRGTRSQHLKTRTVIIQKGFIRRNPSNEKDMTRTDTLCIKRSVYQSTKSDTWNVNNPFQTNNIMNIKQSRQD